VDRIVIRSFNNICAGGNTNNGKGHGNILYLLAKVNGNEQSIFVIYLSLFDILKKTKAIFQSSDALHCRHIYVTDEIQNALLVKAFIVGGPRCYLLNILIPVLAETPTTEADTDKHSASVG